jgi:glycerophosphoryl diester phosphodiesterase
MRSVLTVIVAAALSACATGDTVDETGVKTGATTSVSDGGGGHGGSGGSSTTSAQGGSGGFTTTTTSAHGGSGGFTTTSTSAQGGSGGSSTTTSTSGQGGGETSSTTSTTSADPNGCPADQCFIDGMCVEAGTPNSADPCQVCVRSNASLDWWPDATSPACDGQAYWTGISRALSVTPYGRETAVSCHNCYVVGASSAASLTSTLTTIHQAQANGADLIELDLKDQGGVVYVDHNDAGTTTGAIFGDVLADAALKSGTEMLFIELKETTESESFVRSVLQTLMTSGYGKQGRPVFLRAFNAVSHNLAIAQRLLATAEFVALRPYVRLHVLIDTQQSAVLGVKNKGYHGVEFQYQSANLFGAMTYAQSLNLGTNAWTIPTSAGEVFVATLRDEVDAITCDYSVSLARQVIKDNNGLLYMNAWNQAAGSAPTWYRTSAAVELPLANALKAPSLVDLGLGKPLFGSALLFKAADGLFAETYDGDNDPSGGYLVSAVVQFDETTPSQADTAVLIGKANAGSFSLELYKPTNVLRFGVHVNGGYQYATYPTSKLTTTQSYVVTGAYDGDGGVWLWVNNDATSSTTAGPFSAGVTQNDSPILVGADPEVGSPRFYFSGKIQTALVQKWANH